MLVSLLHGFSAGIPLLLIGSTLQAWMTDANVDLTVIGMFSLVGIPYSLKFLWAPLLDRYLPPVFDRRRGWILIFQITLMVSIAMLGFSNPAASPMMIALMAFLVCFFSASQDIVIDAYRRELFEDDELGFASSLYVNGYRIAMLVSGAMALYLADHISWQMVYVIMSLMMLIGIITTIFAPSSPTNLVPPKTLQAAVVEPFIEFFKRDGALMLLLFILLYKVGDSMASAMTTPFILKTGFTKTDIAAIAKTFGMAATIGGGLLGGIIMLKIHMNKSLWIFGILQAVSTFGFSILAMVGMNHYVLTGVIAFENFSSGMGTAAYAAFMAALCNKKFTATQYALLTSFMALPRTVISSGTGYMAKNLGWEMFFIVCTLAAIPGMLLLFKIAPWKGDHIESHVDDVIKADA